VKKDQLVRQAQQVELALLVRLDAPAQQVQRVLLALEQPVRQVQRALQALRLLAKKTTYHFTSPWDTMITESK
jgi:hypothetical protein